MDQHMAAIVALQERVRGHDEDIARHEKHLSKLDETVSELRTIVATVATKEDVLSLSRNIDEKFSVQLRDANNSMPAKIGVLIAAAGVLIALIQLVSAFASHHG